MAYRAEVVQDFYRSTYRLRLAQQVGDRTFYATHTNPEMHTVGPGEEITDDGIVLPRGSLVAIADALDEFLGKRHPHESEIARLEEALEVERRRVDTALLKVLGS